jgi:hypothetical protein
MPKDESFHFLWREGISMMRSATRFLAAILMVYGVFAGAVQAQVPVSWDGGNDDFAAAKWNGGMTATAVFGDTRITNGAYDITIGSGSTVTYDAPGTGGGLRPRSNTGPTTVTINDGATLWHTTVQAGDTDGMWTEWDAGLNLDNGTFKRDFIPGGNAQAGGILMFGSWRSVQNQVININLTNGGKLDNDGQVWFGADEEHALGLKVNMTINNGTVDLTGGSNYPTQNDSNVVLADFAVWYGTDQGDGDGTTGSGLSKGEKYKVDFKGPGSITVDQAGIWVYDEDAIGIWDDHGGAQTYQYLWDRGILRSQGVSGGFGSDFNNFFTVTGTAGADNYVLTRKDPTVVTWDGGDDDWAAAKWNGGQTAAAVMGDTRITNGAYDITIGGGATVTYDAPGTGGGLRPRSNTGPTTVTIKEGATLWHTTVQAGDTDGMWTEWDANLNLDNGTLKRDFQPGGNAQAGGILMFGSWRSLEGQEIDINMTHGGKIINDGQIWFGADEEHAVNLNITMTINDGSLDLTGGDNYPTQNDSNVVLADWAFWYGTDQGDGNGTTGSGLAKNEQYAVNFTGPGSITVDSAGIWVYDEDSIGIWDDHGGAQTYEYLWSRGILQANGLSGLTGAIFGDYFSTTGTAGSDDYILTSLLGAGLAGDYNGNGVVDAADYVLWRKDPGSYGGPGGYATWRSHFGETAGSGSSLGSAAAVPEPTGLALCLMGMLAMLPRRRGA